MTMNEKVAKIHNRMDNVTCLDNDLCPAIVARVLAYLTEDVVDKVIDECHVIMPRADGEFIHKEHIVKDNIILL